MFIKNYKNYTKITSTHIIIIKEKTMSDYKLGIKELDNGIESIRKGSNIMMIGPPMSGKEYVLNHIMYHGASINGNAITTCDNTRIGHSISGMVQRK